LASSSQTHRDMDTVKNNKNVVKRVCALSAYEIYVPIEKAQHQPIQKCGEGEEKRRRGSAHVKCAVNVP